MDLLGWVSRNFEKEREKERERDILAQDSDSFNKLKTLFKFVLTFTYLRIQKRLSTFQERFSVQLSREREDDHGVEDFKRFRTLKWTYTKK